MSNIDYKRFMRGLTPGFPFYRDAYQIAENTPKSRHGDGCRSYGMGALVTDVATFPTDRVCTCWVVREAQNHIDRGREACIGAVCANGCKCYV
jgi:hypothetical protein